MATLDVAVKVNSVEQLSLHSGIYGGIGCPHSTVMSTGGFNISGPSVSSTVTVVEAVAVFPQSSVAVHV